MKDKNLISKIWLKPVIVFALFFAFSGCAATQENIVISQNERASWALPIDSAKNLYKVDHLLFRSAQLDESALETLKSLGVKSIVNLRFFNRGDDKEAFKNNEFELLNFPLISWDITPKELAQILHEIRRLQKDGAVLIHCYHGADRTGLVAAMYRVIYQGWTLESARREMIYGEFGFHSIWRDIANFLTPQNERAVRDELDKFVG